MNTYAYISNNGVTTADSFSDLAKKLAQEIKYMGVTFSQVNVPNTGSIDNAKNSLFSKANKILHKNMEDIMAITFEKDIEYYTEDPEEAKVLEAKVQGLFDLYFKMVDAKLDRSPLWREAVTHLGSELQI